MNNIRTDWSDETKAYITEVNNTLTSMGVLESVDSKNIILLGDAYDMYLLAKENVREQGLTIGKGDRMKRTANYWVGIARNDIDVCGGCRGLIGI
mgnify:CR=1 FL=1